MKQVLLALAVLLFTMALYYWAGNRLVPKNGGVLLSEGKEISAEIPENIQVQMENEIILKAKHEKGKIVGFLLNLSFDPKKVQILSVEANKEIFNYGVESKIDQEKGKIMVKGRYEGEKEVSVNEEINLTTIKIKGLEKGETIISAENTPIVEVWDGEKITEESFKLSDFKLKFL